MYLLKLLVAHAQACTRTVSENLECEYQGTISRGNFYFTEIIFLILLR